MRSFTVAAPVIIALTTLITLAQAEVAGPRRNTADASTRTEAASDMPMGLTGGVRG